MSKYTNTGLVELAEKALKEGWGYVNGTFGNILTETLMSQKCSQSGGVGQYNTYWKDKYIKKFIGKRVSDCYGLVKAYVWWTGENSSPSYNSNGCVDRNQEGAYSVAKEKGPLSTMPDLPGVILWMKGHVGIYVGNGEFIECAGCPVGTRKGTIINGVITSGSKFTHWFKDNWISYESVEKEFTLVEAKQYVQQQTDIDNNSIQYLSAYKYDTSLLTKAAKAIYKKEFKNKYNRITITEDVAVEILIKACEYNGATIQYLKDDYKYGGSLVIKMAKAMI